MIQDFHWTTPMWDVKEFKSFEIGFKVPAILSDGQWYTPRKIRQFTGESVEDVLRCIHSLIDSGEDIVVSDNGESFRMGFAGVRDWRSAHGIGLEDQLIPTILYPRIISDGERRYTEPEVFEMVPLHRFGQVRFMLVHSDDIAQITAELHDYGRFTQDDAPEKWRLTCLAGDIGKAALEDYERRHGGPGAVFDPHGRPNVYNTGRQRDINEFRPALIEPIIRFYQTFRTTSASGVSRPAIMQPSAYRTLRVYADDGDGENGVVSQLNKWIISAIQHYNERSGVPFAAYLGFIANNRVNDLSSAAIGRPLSKFQNRKARAVKGLNSAADEPGRWYSDADIRAEMARQDPDYVLSREEYSDMDMQLKTWQQTRHTTNLQWDESGEEKQVGDFEISRQLDSFGGPGAEDEHDASLSRIQHAVIHAGVATGDFRSARLMMEMLRNSSGLGAALLSGLSGELGDGYRTALATALSTSNGAGGADIARHGGD